MAPTLQFCVETNLDNLMNPLNEDQLRNSLIESIDKLLPPEKHALHRAAKLHFHNHGKLIRGITALLIANAINLNQRCAISWAVAIELMHNASLIHDDICDGDKYLSLIHI